MSKIKGKFIENDAITSEKIADGSVDTVDLKDGAVTMDKLSSTVQAALNEQVDANQKFFGGGKISVTLGELSFTDDIKIARPGLDLDDNIIEPPVSPIAIAENELLYVIPNKDDQGGTLTPTLATSSTLPNDALILAYRDGNDIIVDGIRLEPGESGKLAQAPLQDAYTKDDIDYYSNIANASSNNLLSYESSKFESVNGSPSIGFWTADPEFTLGNRPGLVNNNCLEIYHNSVDVSGKQVSSGPIALKPGISDKDSLQFTMIYSVDGPAYVSGDMKLVFSGYNVVDSAWEDIETIAGDTAINNTEIGELKVVLQNIRKYNQIEVKLVVDTDSTPSTKYAVYIDAPVLTTLDQIMVPPVDRQAVIDLTGKTSTLDGTNTWASGKVIVSRSGSIVTVGMDPDDSPTKTAASADGAIDLAWLPEWAQEIIAGGTARNSHSGSSRWTSTADTGGYLFFRRRAFDTNEAVDWTSLNVYLQATYQVAKEPTNVMSAAELELKGKEYYFTPPGSLPDGVGNILWSPPPLTSAPFTYNDGVLTFQKECTLAITAYVGHLSQSQGGLSDGNDARIFYAFNNEIGTSGISMQDDRILAAPPSAVDRRRTLNLTRKFFPGQFFRVGYEHNKGSDAVISTGSFLNIVEIPDLSVVAAIAGGENNKMPEVLRTASQRTVNYSTDKYVPIVASGSNSDGSWIRYADGTQMCFGWYNNERENANEVISVPVLWPLPFDEAPFSVSTNVSGSSRPDIQSAITCSALRVDGTTFHDFRTNSSFATVRYAAFGRWK